ncbi:C40 family peptidase [Acetonema longum]|uniref:NLP/P60 protein n=1 Tax=Acetonema longum DSM 6540 TaxID=1009370 RepID=F7NGH1_9FIRM|nr:C40 family peptidase [Acetonema longum]EGO64775.1 NLP/P60 protein [Acetonema longum DSM 6540]
MHKCKLPITFVLLFSLSVALLVPATPAYAFSISDLLGQTSKTQASSGSGGSIIDVLLGLLIGSLFNNLSQSDDKPVRANDTLGATTNSKGAAKTGLAIVNTAQKYMGVPYVWGGSTPKGFDCSGFTQYVMKQHGITIPRTAAEQYNTGAKIKESNLQVGDLVFFTTYKPGASHVGFYLGNRKFVHAGSGAKQVTISSLDENYYKSRYLGARRYI